ncbi:UDP-glucose 4-epimerase GalE [Oceanobacter mangrovi]|uniref:UDP-glucose 4-epimerase GalE n=1 Tax=Oceanobacter mangrovi TaxID=2862510 RepID=UPI001C8D7EB2|nr:UDP-glucose 4-epimerase GalE [Oceanobacter mangrovi]
MKILVTGGLGYIGSHFAVCAIQASKEIVIVDSLENSSLKVLDAIESITGTRPVFYQGKVQDRELMTQVFNAHSFDSVVHFAGYKAVGESTKEPLMYYQNNVAGSAVLMDMMKEYGVNKLVFSSSATVYGVPEFVPYTESHRIAPFNVYGHSKAMTEVMMQGLCEAQPDWSAIALRYFNPVGAHESGDLGEDPKGIPNNLMPFITKVAVGELAELGVFGDDYDTVDGTGVRDYLHVMDLAEGHLKALSWLDANKGFKAVNLGTGNGMSVLQMVESFERVNGVKVPYSIKPRRDGDLPAFWADASLAKELFDWQANRTLDDMMRDSWHWQSRHPRGYQS